MPTLLSRLVHGAQPDESSTDTEVRAKALPRTTRTFSAARFDAALTRAGTSSAVAAKSLGVSETLVRGYRAGTHRLPWDSINELPESVEMSLLEARIAELRAKSLKADAPIESTTLIVMTRVGALCATLQVATADGVIDDDELALISRDAGHVAEAAHVIEHAPLSRRFGGK